MRDRTICVVLRIRAPSAASCARGVRHSGQPGSTCGAFRAPLSGAADRRATARALAVASALYSDSDGFRFAESRADRPSMGIRRGSGPTPEVRGQAVLMARWASQRAPPAVAVSVPQRPGGRRAQGRRICRGRRPGVRGNMLLQNVARRTDTCHRASDAASSMPCASSRSSSPVFCPCRAGRGDGVREASAREVPPPCSSRPGPEMPWYAGHRR